MHAPKLNLDWYTNGVSELPRTTAKRSSGIAKRRIKGIHQHKKHLDGWTGNRNQGIFRDQKGIIFETIKNVPLNQAPIMLPDALSGCCGFYGLGRLSPKDRGVLD